jgi:peroxiredoxin
MTAEIGYPVPEFSLGSHQDKKISINDYRGRCNVVLAFFPLAWTPV